MSSLFPTWHIEEKAEEARKVSAIIEAAIPRHEEQMEALHVIYEMWREGDYATVNLLLDILEGAWV